MLIVVKLIVIMLSDTNKPFYAHYSECRYTECHYAECQNKHFCRDSL